MCDNKTIKELLPLYLEQEIGEGGRKLVEEHLGACPDCRRELSLLTIMSEETVPDPGEAFWASMPGRVYRAVEDGRTRSRKSGLVWFGERMVLPRWSWAAAALAILLLLSWLIINPFHRQEGDRHLVSDVYDYSYGSMHDPALTHPATDMSDLSPAQLETVDSWAGRELAAMASEAESATLNPVESEPAEELTELTSHQIERLSTMLDDYNQEG